MSGPALTPADDPRPLLAIGDVIRAAAEFYGSWPDDLRSARCDRPTVAIRQRAMWLARRLTLRSLPVIGLAFGGRNHAGVLRAVRKVEADRATDPDLAASLSALEDALRDRFAPAVRRCDPPVTRTSAR